MVYKNNFGKITSVEVGKATELIHKIPHRRQFEPHALESVSLLLELLVVGYSDTLYVTLQGKAHVVRSGEWEADGERTWNIPICRDHVINNSPVYSYRVLNCPVLLEKKMLLIIS